MKNGGVVVGVGYIDEYVAEAFDLHGNGVVEIEDFDGNCGSLVCVGGKYQVVATSLVLAVKLAKFLSYQKDSYSSSLLGATRLATRVPGGETLVATSPATTLAPL